MGLFESILARSRPDWQPTVDPAFPELKPDEPLPEPAADASWLKTMMQNAAITKQRKDRSGQATISGTLADVDPSLGIKQALASVPGIGAGMLGGGEAPMPAARPAGAPGPVYPDDRGSPAPQPMAALPSATSTEVSSRNGRPAMAMPAAPTQIAPQAPQVAQPPAAPESPFGLPSIFDKIRTTLGDNSNTLLALGAGFAGAPNIGQGISRAAAAAIPARAADISQKLQLSGQAGLQQALIDAGVPRQQAFAAVGNPKLAEALIQNYIVDRKHELKTVKDWMGNESLVDFDPFTSKTKPATFDSADGSSAPGVPSSGIMAAARMEPNYDPSTNRDEGFLDAVRKTDPLTASAVQDIAEGKMPANGRNMQKMMPLVARYEQGFENNRYTARQNLEKSYYGGGEGAKQLRSANTVIDHGIDLKKAIDDLHNYSVLPGYLNPVTGKLAENRGDKKYQDALARFKSNSLVYTKELENALTGKVTVSGQKELQALFNEYAAPTANHAALQQTLGMLEKRVNEHENTYRTGMNKPSHSFDADMLTNRSKLDKLLAGDTGSGAKAAKPVATFKPGGHYKMVDGEPVEK